MNTPLPALWLVVSTIKKRGSSSIKGFSAVPHGWVDGSFVYWPKSGLRALLANGQSMPDKQSWEKMPCRIHRTKIPSYEEAVELEEKFTEIDTEDEVK